MGGEGLAGFSLEIWVVVVGCEHLMDSEEAVVCVTYYGENCEGERS